MSTELLRQLDLPDVAAAVIKHTPIASIRNVTAESTTLYTACGRCQKPLNRSPFGFCSRCAAPAVLCAVCHRRIVGVPLVLCSTCGHGAHEMCLSLYSAVSPVDGDYFSAPWSRFSSRLTTPATSAPSTPRILEPWLFHVSPTSPFAASIAVPEPAGEGDERTCPSGCGHSPCALVRVD